jgi:DNA invertase Pin-like site-specific DNA recombinase
VLDLQRDALVAAGVDERHLFEDRVSGSRGDRTGLAKALAFIKSGDCLVAGNWAGWGDHYRIS